MQSGFSQQVVAFLRLVPPGRLVSYGQVAKALNHPHSARQVGVVLSALGSEQADVPWHRVLNWRGGISYRQDFFASRDPVKEQAQRLQQEGLMPDTQGYYSLTKWGLSEKEAQAIAAAIL